VWTALAPGSRKRFKNGIGVLNPWSRKPSWMESPRVNPAGPGTLIPGSLKVNRKNPFGPGLKYPEPWPMKWAVNRRIGNLGLQPNGIPSWKLYWSENSFLPAGKTERPRAPLLQLDTAIGHRYVQDRWEAKKLGR